MSASFYESAVENTKQEGKCFCDIRKKKSDLISSNSVRITFVKFSKCHILTETSVLFLIVMLLSFTK